MKPVHFPSINSLRFFAALAVILHHIEQLKGFFGWQNPHVGNLGLIGVLFFFVLSGYLITYLLLEEERVFGKVDLRKFYVRRALRIFPVYYVLVLLAFFVFPAFTFFQIPGWSEALHDHFSEKVWLNIFFLPNLSLSVFGVVPLASQCWSIGVEEQFYLMWPWLVKLATRKYVKLVVIIFIVLVVLARIWAQTDPHWSQNTGKAFFLLYFPIDALAIGGLFATLITDQTHLGQFARRLLFNRIVQCLLYLVLVVSLWKNIYIPYLNQQFYTILFGAVILNLTINPKTVVSFENKYLGYLGKISYGLYMYHPIAIVVCLHWLPVNSNVQLYIFSILFVCILAVLSYEFFEKRIMRYKIRFSNIVSG